MGAKPTVLHFGYNSDTHRCGAEPIDWAEKYLTDEYASALPKCPDCLKSYELEHGSEMLSTPSNDKVMPLKTLRMYLNT